MTNYVGTQGAKELKEHIRKKTDMNVKLSMAARDMNIQQFIDLEDGEIGIEYRVEKPLQFQPGQKVLELRPG